MGKLIGSTSDLDQLKDMVFKWFYSEISLVPDGLRQWKIHNSKGEIEGCRIVLKGKRYRFEMT